MTEITGALRKRVVYYMAVNVADHTDPLTDEINATTLAEDACQAFDLYGDAPDYAIPDDLFDLSFEVAERLEGKAKVFLQ